MAVDPRKTLPTKINLIKLRKEYKVIKKIRGVLEEKRNALILYIRTLIEEYQRSYLEVAEELSRAYTEFGEAALETGYDRLKQLSEATGSTLKAEIKERVVFAVKVPVISLRKEVSGSISMIDFPPRLITASRRLSQALEKYSRIVEIETSIRRMIKELKNTQRLINSIDYVILPSYEKTIKHIKLILEERMREEFMRLKVIKRKRG